MTKRGTAAMVFGALLILGAIALSVYNLNQEKRAGESVDSVLSAMEKTTLKVSAPANPLPEAGGKMDTVTIDGRDYIGVLALPAIGIQLPVLSEWNYPLLKISPCRYAGTVSQGAFVIAAHNYTRHFGKLGNMTEGDRVTFTDVNGGVYSYTIERVITLQKTQIEEMLSTDWDLTLFTCDYRGRLRIAVRCELDKSPVP